MEENTNSIFTIIAGVIVLALIVTAFFAKIPDLVGGASKSVTDTYQTQ